MSHDNELDSLILTIVQKRDVYEQTDLQKLLEEQGHIVSQATLSRHLKNLGVSKVGGIYKFFPEVSKHNVPLVLNIQVSDFGLIVLHTYPGHASGLAYFIDQKYVNQSGNKTGNSDILGTLAGDDTVLVITKNKVSLERVVALMATEFPASFLL